MPQEESEEDPKESQGKHTTLPDPTVHTEGPREAATKLHSPLHAGTEGLN